MKRQSERRKWSLRHSSRPSPHASAPACPGIETEFKSLSEKGSDPLEASRFHWLFCLAGEGQAPFRIGSNTSLEVTVSKKTSAQGPSERIKQAAHQTTSKQKLKDEPLPDDRFINRELSWLDFNQRVLDQAFDESLPLLERVKFLAITASNLDEFVMVRIGGLKLQHQRNSMVRDPAGMTPAEQLESVSVYCKRFMQRQYQLLLDVLQPQLAQANIHRVDLNQCSETSAGAAEARFRHEVLSVLTPHALSVDRPFPTLPGLGVHLCVRLLVDPEHELGIQSDAGDDQLWQFAIIPLGRVLPRLIPLPSDLPGHSYVLLEDLVMQWVDQFFPGRQVVECVPFRITRNADIELREDGAGDLLGGMEEVLESRRLSRVVRLEYDSSASDMMIAFLSERMQVTQLDLFPIDGPLDLTNLFALHSLEGFDSLRDDAWPPQSTPEVDPSESMFSTISAGDLLMVHPFERFDPVVRFLEEAAVDPDVMAIKQVLYRTSKNSPIVAALMRAAEHGKYVSVIVELKARFDEARNIEWAREMEQAGVQVIYGIRGLKTHAKICVIMRREPHGIIRYVHFGTGNYNESTAKIYSDVSLLTCDEVLGADATTFFNSITGASQPQQLQELAAAPISLRKKLMDLIEAETRRCMEGQRAEIVAKLNSLVDTEMIDALYQASRAGVRIRLNVRGACCLRPGVPGLSETIEVVSIVDRFLEHARIIYFRHGGNSQLFISSADWMPRNLDRRVELLIPVADPTCREKLLGVLRTYFKDNQNAWQMLPSGMYKRVLPAAGVEPFRSQRKLFERASKLSRDSQASRRTAFETHLPRERSL